MKYSADRMAGSESLELIENATGTSLGCAGTLIGSGDWVTDRTGPLRFESCSDALSALVALHEGHPVEGAR